MPSLFCIMPFNKVQKIMVSCKFLLFYNLIVQVEDGLHKEPTCLLQYNVTYVVQKPSEESLW